MDVKLESDPKTASVTPLFAAERSGTHLFRSILSTNGAAHAPGEVANAGAPIDLEQKTNFFAFRESLFRQAPGLSIPTRPNMQHLLEVYIASLREQAAKRHAKFFVCDIKYAHVVNFSSGWWDMISPPYLFEFISAQKMASIHLIRRKIGQTCISNIYALQTGVWRTTDPNEISSKTIRVNRGQLLNDVERLRTVINLFRRWLQPSRVAEIYYEDLLEGDSASWKKLREFFAHPIDRIASDFIKTTPPYEKIIANFDEIKDILTVDFDDDPALAALRRR